MTGPLHCTLDCTEDGRSIGMREHRHLRGSTKPGHQLIGLGPCQSITDFVPTVRTFLGKVMLLQNSMDRAYDISCRSRHE